jgi:hypothetical protein
MAGYVPDLTCSSSPARSRTPFCTLPHGMRGVVECGWASRFIFAIKLLLVTTRDRFSDDKVQQHYKSIKAL